MSIPKISVIVPVYNTDKYLDRCINSILTQSFTDFELLLVNDGSTDESGLICDEYATQDPRIRVFHKTNGGVSSARNLGLQEAQGEWITFVDSDDYIEADYLKLLKPQFGDELIIDNSDVRGTVSKYGTCVGVDMIKECCDSWKILTIWGKLYKSEYINNRGIRFIPYLKTGEDTIFNIEYLTQVDSARFVEYMGYNYNVAAENSLSKSRVSLNQSLNKALGVYELGNKLALKYHNPQIKSWISRYAGITWTLWTSLLEYDLENRSQQIKELFRMPEVVALMRNYLKCDESGKKYKLFYWLCKIKLYRVAAMIIP